MKSKLAIAGVVVSMSIATAEVSASTDNISPSTERSHHFSSISDSILVNAGNNASSDKNKGGRHRHEPPKLNLSIAISEEELAFQRYMDEMLSRKGNKGS